jgi:hypothetical protein
LPKPDHRPLHAHPTVSAELYDRVGHGDLVMKPTIERLDGETIRAIKEARARKPKPSLLDRVTAPLAGLRS